MSGWLRKPRPQELHPGCHSELWTADGCQAFGKNLLVCPTSLIHQCTVHWGSIFCRNQEIFHIACPLFSFFPCYLFPSVVSSEGLRVLCAHHCSGLCQEVVSPPRGYLLSPASRAIRPFPCAKGREESQRTGNKWSLLSQGAAGVQGPSLDPAWEGMGVSECQGTFKVRINNFCLTQQRSWSWQREKSRSEWHGNGAGRTLHKEQGEGSFTSQPGHSGPCKWGL